MSLDNNWCLSCIWLSVPDFYTGGCNFTITDSTAQVLGRVGSFSTFHTACSSLSAMGALETTSSSNAWSATQLDISRSSIEMQRSGSDYTLYTLDTPEMVASPGPHLQVSSLCCFAVAYLNLAGCRVFLTSQISKLHLCTVGKKSKFPPRNRSRISPKW